MAKPRRLTVEIDGEDVGLSKALGESTKKVTVFGKEVGLNFDIPTSKLEIAGVAIKGIAKGTKAVATAAKDAAAEEAIFNDAMGKATGQTGDYVTAMDDVIAAGQKKAFTDTEQMKALASLSTATGDATEASTLLSGAQDIARLAGVDLEVAADAVAKAYAGQDSQLRKLLPGLEKGATAQDTIKNATDLAAGAADNYAKSSQAMGEKAKIAFGEVAEIVGTALGPALHDLAEALKPLLKAFLELISKLLPPLIKYFSKIIELAAKVAEAIGKIVDAVKRLIDKVRELLGPLGEMVDKLKNIDLNPFKKAGGSVPQTAGMSQFSAAQPAATSQGRGGVTINIYGDPSVIEARVTKALRDYARRNGVAAVFTPNRA